MFFCFFLVVLHWWFVCGDTANGGSCSTHSKPFNIYSVRSLSHMDWSMWAQLCASERQPSHEIYESDVHEFSWLAREPRFVTPRLPKFVIGQWIKHSWTIFCVGTKWSCKKRNTTLCFLYLCSSTLCHFLFVFIQQEVSFHAISFSATKTWSNNCIVSISGFIFH